jgi:hypothetical protein
MTEEKILTLHPQGKQGTNISKSKYDQMKGEIINALKDEPDQTFSGLNDVVGKRLDGNFDGSIGWYYTTVKLDLGARGIIERVPNSSPQKLRLVE